MQLYTHGQMPGQFLPFAAYARCCFESVVQQGSAWMPLATLSECSLLSVSGLAKRLAPSYGEGVVAHGSYSSTQEAQAQNAAWTI